MFCFCHSRTTLVDDGRRLDKIDDGGQKQEKGGNVDVIVNETRPQSKAEKRHQSDRAEYLLL